MKEDWVECTLGEILSVSSGKGLTSKKMDGGAFPVYGGNGITGYHSQYIFSERKLIIGRVGVRCGVTHITQVKSWITDNALVVNLKSKSIDLIFLELKLQYENLNKLSNSTAQPVISGTKIHSYSIELPPLPIQRAIVAKIEELFSSLDSGINDLKKAQEQLVIYRQAVLKKAFEGELTKEWREKNKIIFNWEKTTTGEVMPDISSGSTPKAEFLFKEGEIQFLKVYNLNFDGTFNESKDPAFTTYKIHTTANRRAITKAGDVLINIVGPPLGKCSMIPLNCKVEFNINQAIVRFRPNDKILPKFLSCFLQNPETINWLEGTSKATAGQFNIKVTTCRIIPISLPTLKEQHQIVREIESRLSVCDKVEESITESLVKAIALRQSILKKAFEGNLLSKEEVAKCKQEKDYEPASVLLERIKAEKKQK